MIQRQLILIRYLPNMCCIFQTYVYSVTSPVNKGLQPSAVAIQRRMQWLIFQAGCFNALTIT